MSVKGMPDPGAGRFWHGVHQPKSLKTPLMLELRQKIAPNSATTVVSMSTLIARQGTVADEDAVEMTAKEILTRAARVDEFVGIIDHG